MTTFHIAPSSYFGDEATLASGDRDGLRMFVDVLQTALDSGEAGFDSDSIRYRIERRSGAAELAVGIGTLWCSSSTVQRSPRLSISQNR